MISPPVDLVEHIKRQLHLSNRSALDPMTLLSYHFELMEESSLSRIEWIVRVI